MARDACDCVSCPILEASEELTRMVKEWIKNRQTNTEKHKTTQLSLMLGPGGMAAASQQLGVLCVVRTEQRAGLLHTDG